MLSTSLLNSVELDDELSTMVATLRSTLAGSRSSWQEREPAGAVRMSGLSLFCVPLEGKAVRIVPMPKTVHHAIASCELLFDDMAVPDDYLIGQEAKASSTCCPRSTVSAYWPPLKQSESGVPRCSRQSNTRLNGRVSGIRSQHTKASVIRWRARVQCFPARG
jgi:hypothetical protein